MQDLIDDVVFERPRLENAPLKAVICQARFPRQLSLSDDAVRPIQRALSHRYPMLAEEQAVEMTIGGRAESKAFFTQGGARRRIFRFRDVGESWIATIGPEAISLETTQYEGMKDLLIRWSELAVAVGEALELTAQTRLGLRYINELDCPGPRKEDLEGLVRKELLTLLGTQPAREDLLRFVSQAQFRQPDGPSCNMRHGIAPSEGEQDRTVFLLDLDCFWSEAAEFDPAEQIRSLAKLNESAYGFFIWAFSDRTFERFAERSVGDWRGHGKERLWESPRKWAFADVFCDTLDFGGALTSSAEGRESDRIVFVEAKAEKSTAPLLDAGRAEGAPAPLSEVLESLRESIDIPIADLARMIGMRRRQFYNLLAGNSTSTETEARIRRLAAAIDRLAIATEGGPQALRAAVLTPVGPDAINLFEVAEAGDEKQLAAVVEMLAMQIESRGIRRTRRAIPRPVPPGVAEQRRRLMREALSDRPPHRPREEGSDGRE